MDEMMAHPPEYMDQHIAGSDEDMSRYIGSTKDELNKCIMRVLLAAAQTAYNGEGGPASKIIEQGIDCYHRYFNSMKGATNLCADDVISFVSREIKKQRDLQRCLNDLAADFAAYGVRLEIMPPGQIYSDPVWNIPLSTGSTVRIEDRAYISAFSPRPAATSDYMALRQDPVAARLIYMDASTMLFLQHDQDAGDRFAQACTGLLGEPADLAGDFDGAWNASISGNVLLLDTPYPPAAREVEPLMKRYGVCGLIAANSASFSARLYVAGYKESRLEYEVQNQQ